MKNIFIEGIQGAGKSTLLALLHKHMPQYKVYYEGDISPVELAWCSYMTEEQYQNTCMEYPGLCNEIEKHTVTEGDRKITDYTHILTDIQGFHKYMEKYEIYNGNIPYKDFRNIIFTRYKDFNKYGNIFECSFFQNIIECLMLFYQMPANEIIEFYKEAYNILKDKNFLMVYIEITDIREAISVIRKERTDGNGNEMWFPLMTHYLENSPYGKRHYKKKECGNGINNNDMDILVSHLERRKKLEHSIISIMDNRHVVIIPSKKYKIEEVVRRLN